VDVVSLTAVRRERPLGAGRKIDRRFLSLFFAVVDSCFYWGILRNWFQNVVFLWSFYGEMRGESWLRNGCFSAAETTP
jgi:hypothetical protein